MKRASVCVLSALLLMATVGSARAEKEVGLGLSYDPRVPVGDLRSVVPDATLSGVQGRWDYYAFGHLTLGIEGQYHYFQARSRLDTIAIDNGAATAPFTRQAYFVSLLPVARYYPFRPTEAFVRPYVELGVGATSASGSFLASDLSRRANVGGLIAQPAFGVVVPFSSHVEGPPSELSSVGDTRPRREKMFGLSASLAWSFTTVRMLTTHNASYVGAQIGIYSTL